MQFQSMQSVKQQNGPEKKRKEGNLKKPIKEQQQNLKKKRESGKMKSKKRTTFG